MKIPPVSVIVFIVVLGCLHALFVTPMEKEFVQLMTPTNSRVAWTLRPNTSSTVPLTRWDYGMPSGHASFAGLTGGLAYFMGIAPLWLFATYVVLMAVQRVGWRRHTVLQVVIGSLLGTLYALLYAHLDTGSAIVACLLIIIVWIMATLVMSKRRHAKDVPPDWAQKTTHTPTDPLVFQYLSNMVNLHSYGHLTWKDVETLVDMYILMLQSMDVTFDAVFPGDHGGKIVGPYMASKLGVPYYPRAPPQDLNASKHTLTIYANPVREDGRNNFILAPQGALSWPWNR